MYILNEFEQDSMGYNVTIPLDVQGKLDLAKIQEAFHLLIQRHESLRTGFAVVDGEFVQKINSQIDFQIEEIKIDGGINETIQKFVRPFDITKAPLLRIGLLSLSADQHILIFDIHHIISDGTSSGILIRDFSAFYQGEMLPELRVQYKDFATWQNNLLKSEELKRQEMYWLNLFSGEIHMLNLPTDYSRPAIKSFAGGVIYFTADKELLEKLHRLAREQKVTLYMILLAAYTILLYRYSGQEDIIVGSPVAGRPHVDLRNIVGMFVNMVAMRNYPERDKTFIQFLKEVKDHALEAFENQDYQFEMLVSKLQKKMDGSRNPLFDAVLVLQNMDRYMIQADDLQFSLYEYDAATSKFDIKLMASETEEGLSCNIEYSTTLFKRETIERLSRHFLNILVEVADHPEQNLSEIKMLSKEEEEQMICDLKAEKLVESEETNQEELIADFDF